jgi:cytochrome c oxidase subunit 2
MVSKVEVAWTLAVVALLAGVASYSTFLLYHLDALPAHPSEVVDVIGHQWYWEFCYPANHTCFNATYNAASNTASGGALWAPAGTSIVVNVTGADVVHSFNIPSLGVRIDSIPGRYNYYTIVVPDVAPGTEYLIQCTEFCGTFHGTMRAFLVVT